MELLSIAFSLGLAIVSPAHGHRTTEASVDVVADVQPTGSPIVETTCNGERAALANLRITCRVSLAPGRNSVVVQAFSEDGSQVSAGVSVYRSASGSVLVGPRDVTIPVGQIMRFRAMTDDGRPAPATWRSSAPDVVTADLSSPVAEAGVYRIRAVAVGNATISASSDAGSGDTRITVVAAPPSPGAIVAAAALPRDGEVFDTVFTHQTDPDVPELHAVIRDEQRRVTLVGIGDGGQPWSVDQPHVRAPLGDWHAMGETFGGVVLFDGHQWPTGLVRTAGPPDARPWRYRASERIDGMAQDHSGTIFLAETASDGTAAIAVLDGRSGRPLTRVPVRGSDRVEEAHCGLAETTRPTGVAAWTKPIVHGAAGIVVLERHERVSFDGCTASARDVAETMWLLEVTPEGTPSWQMLRSARRTVAMQDPSPMFEIGGVLPGAGMQVMWRLHGEPDTPGWQLTRTGGKKPGTSPLPIAEPDFTNVMMTFDHLILQSSVEGRVVGIDADTGIVAWSAAISGEFAGIAGRGRIVLRTADRHVAYVTAGRVSAEETVEGLVLPASRALVDGRIVLTNESLADWPWFFGLGRPMPIHQGF